jgi:hypothetical protein
MRRKGAKGTAINANTRRLKMRTSNTSKKAIEFAKKLRVWYIDMKTPRPLIPRFLALDMSLGGSYNADTIEMMVKYGTFDKTKIVIFLEKHGSRYFLVRKSEDYAKIALSIIRERSGWYGYQVNDLEEEEVPVAPKVTIEQAATMDKEVQEIVAELWKKYQANVKRKKIIDENYALLDKALKGDAIAAVKFLYARKRHEYEGFEVIIPLVAGEESCT